MAHPTPRRGGWPGPRKDTAWTFKPDPDAQAAVKRYMEEHRLTGEWGGLTKALNAMLAAKPDARTVKPDTVEDPVEAAEPGEHDHRDSCVFCGAGDGSCCEHCPGNHAYDQAAIQAALEEIQP